MSLTYGRGTKTLMKEAFCSLLFVNYLALGLIFMLIIKALAGESEASYIPGASSFGLP